MDKLLTLEDVIKGVRPIVEADPNFLYPQQENHDEDERCACVENDTSDDEEYYEQNYVYKDCEWHMDDDNTCRYVKNDGAPACVVGHYFVKELGFTDLWHFETKAPTFILEAHGYEVEPRAQRFLNIIQSAQDQGWDWNNAYDQAVGEVEAYGRRVANETK